MPSPSPLIQKLIQDPVGNYPAATVACFDPKIGDLPRRKLDHSLTREFLQRLIAAGQSLRQRFGPQQALLIGASTGQAHLRTPDELAEWFQVAAEVEWQDILKVALLRPEDGIEANERLLDLLAALGYGVVFARPGNNLGPSPSDQEIADNMRPIVAGAARRGLAVGLYSISDVSGYPMSPDAAADLVAGEGGDNVVAIKVTEVDYENSTLRFLDDPRLAHLKIVQGWDPHLARALQDGPRHELRRRQRCGFTSGAMSFAVFNYIHILEYSFAGDWDGVERHQAAVSRIFASMQDDPGKFADLQRAKVIMGLGQPITREVTADQIERFFAALAQLPAGSQERTALIQSLDLLSTGPYHDRLQSLLQ